MLEKLKKSILGNVLLLVLAALVGYGTFKMMRQAVIFWAEYKNQEAGVRELTQKKEELERYLSELQTPQAAEREAKDRLNLKKIGEEVVVVVPPEEKISPETKQTVWQKTKSFFAGILGIR